MDAILNILIDINATLGRIADNLSSKHECNCKKDIDTEVAIALLVKRAKLYREVSNDAITNNLGATNNDAIANLITCIDTYIEVFDSGVRSIELYDGLSKLLLDAPSIIMGVKKHG